MRIRAISLFPLRRRRGGAPPLLFPDGFLLRVAPLSLFFLSSFGRVDFPHLHLRSPSPREGQTCLLDLLLLLFVVVVGASFSSSSSSSSPLRRLLPRSRRWVCVSHHRLRQRLARKQPPPLKPGGRKRRRERKREKREERKSTLSVFFFFYFFFFALFPLLFLLWTPFLGVFFLSRLILSSRNRYYI